ncbi:hypothetical protein OXV40_34295, partial [Burkholderia contaminans]|uniref:hypothetical protein n=1 Tax=Burkholderia contaminans TaxID=488447 RepID=UPI002D7FB604
VLRIEFNGHGKPCPFCSTRNPAIGAIGELPFVRGISARLVRLKTLPTGQPSHSLKPRTKENNRDEEKSGSIEHISWS